MNLPARHLLLSCLFLILVATGCGEDDATETSRHGAGSQASAGQSSRGERPGGAPSGGGFPGAEANQGPAVPVEAAPVARRDISSYIETNGILEAENEVDVVARTTGPIVSLETEEGMTVRRGQRLARIDDRDIRSEVEIARVTLEEARLNFDRSKRLNESRLISPEEYEQAATRFETAKAQYENNQILLGYTEIKAPFSGQIVARYVDLAEQVNSGTALFRISDFDPLLCPIQIPERELPRLAAGQSAYVTVEAWAGERFPAKVLRVSPVVDAATGTVKVTLDVEPDARLRPGMFTRVFLETERRRDTLVVPKAALSLESLGDTVYVVANGVAERRDVTLGFREGDFVEVVAGLSDGDLVVVVGQDGLSNGTPIQVLGGAAPAGSDRRTARTQEATSVEDATPFSAQSSTAAPRAAVDAGGSSEGPRGGPDRSPGGRMDPATMTPEQLEKAKEFMRSRGLSEKEIEERLERRRNRAGSQ